MENLPTDILQKTALNLSPKDIISLCLTNKRFNEKICNSKNFWQNKILIDYPKQIYNPLLFQNTPKTLYMLLSMNSKVVQISSREFPKLSRYDLDDNKMADALTKAITKKFIYQNNLKRGDVLHLQWIGNYRNEGKFLWDGSKAVNLDYTIDDYGSVTTEFAFPEFRPDYFLESIKHNEIVRLSPDKVKEAITNFNVEEQTSYITDKYNKYIIKINYPDLIKIKFGSIFLDENYLDYDPSHKNFILKVPIILRFSFVSNDGNYIENLEFSSKWKDIIVSIVTDITPKNNITYEWNNNTLVIIKHR